MTSPQTRAFYRRVHPDLVRAILEGNRIRVHAVRLSVVRDGSETGFAIDTLPREGRPKEWERTTREICRILKGEADRLPRETKHLLAALAHITPGEPLLLFQVETWLSMQDDGGSWWEVPAFLSLLAIALPDVIQASERAKKKVLDEVCRL